MPFNCLFALFVFLYSCTEFKRVKSNKLEFLSVMFTDVCFICTDAYISQTSNLT